MKKSSTILLLTLVCGIGALAPACAQKNTDAAIDDRLANTPPVKGPAELQQDTAKMIATTPGLTDDQRAKLTAIQHGAGAKIQGLRQESLKLRELLLQEVVRKDYNATEVDRIKTRLRDNDKKRLDTLFIAIDQANEILGRHTSRRDIMDSMMRMNDYDSGFSARF